MARSSSLMHVGHGNEATWPAPRLAAAAGCCKTSPDTLPASRKSVADFTGGQQQPVGVIRPADDDDPSDVRPVVSVARREERLTSDIDLMVIGRIALAELAPALKRAEGIFLRPVNPSIYTPEEVAEKLAAGHHFLATVMSEEKLFVLGDKNDLAAATQLKPRPCAPK